MYLKSYHYSKWLFPSLFLKLENVYVFDPFQMHGYDPSGPVAMSLDSSHTYLSGLDDSTCHLLPRSPSEMSSTTSD